MDTALDQAYHLPPRATAHNIRVVKKTLKLFLGLRLYPASGAYPLLGATTYISSFWGPLKQTNKQTMDGPHESF